MTEKEIVIIELSKKVTELKAERDNLFEKRKDLSKEEFMRLVPRINELANIISELTE